MKKTVFKGTINGKEFNNVQEYNKEMMRLLTSNEKVSASAETKTIDDDECTCNCNGCDCEGGGCCDEKPVDYTPFVTTKHGDYYITLDDIIDNAKESEEKLKEEDKTIDEYLNESYEKLVKAIKNWSTNDLTVYSDEIDNILVRFDEKSKMHKKTQESLETKREEVVNKLETLNETLAVIEKRMKVVDAGVDIYKNVQAFYNALRDIISETFYKKKQITSETKKQPETNIKEKEPQKEFNLSDKDKEVSFMDFLNRLEELSKMFK